VRKQLPWFKVYPEDWLADGVTLFLTPAQRGVFISLQALASTSPSRGIIQAAPGRPYEPSTLARRCRCKQNLLTATLNRLEEIGEITRDEEGIHITGWKDDQATPDIEGRAKDKRGKGPPKGTPGLEEHCELCGKTGHTKLHCPESSFNGFVHR